MNELPTTFISIYSKFNIRLNMLTNFQPNQLKYKDKLTKVFL